MAVRGALRYRRLQPRWSRAAPCPPAQSRSSHLSLIEPGTCLADLLVLGGFQAQFDTDAAGTASFSSLAA
jgi:hypothetical protein